MAMNPLKCFRFIAILSASISLIPVNAHAQVSGQSTTVSSRLSSSILHGSENVSNVSSAAAERMAPSMKALFAAFGIEVDLPRLKRFITEESTTVPAMMELKGLVSSGRQYGDRTPKCRLVFGDAGTISRVSSIRLRDINLQGDPPEWLRTLDRTQCAICERARAANFGPEALNGLNEMRFVYMSVMLAKEFQLVEGIESTSHQ